MLKNETKIVVITGAESTGKSTLTEALSHHYNVPFVPEIARGYIEKLNRKYVFSDVQRIAKMQVEQLNDAVNSKAPLIFTDTWLLVTKVWFEVVFGKSPNWLIGEIKATPIDLFLVCDTDLPWIPDLVRENGGEMREILQKKYLEIIQEFGFEHRIIYGQNKERVKNAIGFIDELIFPSTRKPVVC